MIKEANNIHFCGSCLRYPRPTIVQDRVMTYDRITDFYTIDKVLGEFNSGSGEAQQAV